MKNCILQVQDKGALGAKLVQRYSASLVTSRITYCSLVALGLVYYELAMNESLGSLGVSSATWLCLHTHIYTHTQSERETCLAAICFTHSSSHMLHRGKRIYKWMSFLWLSFQRKLFQGIGLPSTTCPTSLPTRQVGRTGLYLLGLLGLLFDSLCRFLPFWSRCQRWWSRCQTGAATIPHWGCLQVLCCSGGALSQGKMKTSSPGAPCEELKGTKGADLTSIYLVGHRTSGNREEWYDSILAGLSEHSQSAGEMPATPHKHLTGSITVLQEMEYMCALRVEVVRAGKDTFGKHHNLKYLSMSQWTA